MCRLIVSKWKKCTKCPECGLIRSWNTLFNTILVEILSYSVGICSYTRYSSKFGFMHGIVRNLVLSGMAYPVCYIVHFPYYDSIHNFLPTEIMYSVEMETIKRKLLRFPFGIIYPILNSSTLMIWCVCTLECYWYEKVEKCLSCFWLRAVWVLIHSR